MGLVPAQERIMLNRSALIKTMVIGLVIVAVLQVIGWQLTVASGITEADEITEENANALLNSPLFLLMTAMPCVSMLIDMGLGVLYGVFAQRDGSTASSGHFAYGGGVVGALLGLTAGVVSTLLSWDSTPQALAQLQTAMPGATMQTMITLTIGEVVIGTLLTAALAAAGGGIYGAIASSRALQNPPPA
jgi:hypothetical protein